MTYYRISKYDPAYRVDGVYQKDEWTAFSDIGKEYDGTRFLAKITEGEPQLLEHNDLRRITPREIGDYEFCPADEEILNEIVRVYGTKSLHFADSILNRWTNQ